MVHAGWGGLGLGNLFEVLSFRGPFSNVNLSPVNFFFLLKLFAQNVLLHFSFPRFSYGMQIHADVASNWLACFPFSAQKYVYDVFFVCGLVTEVLQILVPFLHQNGNVEFDVNAVITNSER